MAEMTNNHGWKQPVPTVIPELESTPFLKTVFQQLLLRCTNSSKYVNRPDGSPIFLERGQCLVGRYEFAASFGLDRGQSKRIERAINKLIATNLMTKRKNRNCSIVSINNYDEIVGMTKQMTHQRPNSDQTVTTNKSDKSVKSAKETGIARSLKEELPREKIEELATKHGITPERVEQEKQAYILWIKSKPTIKDTQNRSMISTVEAWINKKLASGEIKPELTFEEKIALEAGGLS